MEILSMKNFELLLAEDNLKNIKEKSGKSKKIQQKYMVSLYSWHNVTTVTKPH